MTHFEPGFHIECQWPLWMTSKLSFQQNLRLPWSLFNPMISETPRLSEPTGAWQPTTTGQELRFLPRFGKQPVWAQCPYCQQQVSQHFCRHYLIQIFQGNDAMWIQKWPWDMVSLRRHLLITVVWLLLDSIFSQWHEGYPSRSHILQENYSNSQNAFLDV